jgi:hypothetical protein
MDDASDGRRLLPLPHLTPPLICCRTTDADNDTVVDQMALPSRSCVLHSPKADDVAKKDFCLKREENITAASDMTPTSHPLKPESESDITSKEETSSLTLEIGSLEEEERVCPVPEENLKDVNEDGEDSPPAAHREATQEGFSEESLHILDREALGSTEDKSEQENSPATIDEKQEEAAHLMEVVERDEISSYSDGKEERAKVPPSQGVELLKQEVAHRSHVLGSLRKLDENSARQLLNDSGWNVSQSTRQNGKTQWYYRSPPPKPVLMGSLTSAMALWKEMVDEDLKGKGGADGDPYPVVTAFLSSAKRSATAKKRKRGRQND